MCMLCFLKMSLVKIFPQVLSGSIYLSPKTHKFTICTYATAVPSVCDLKVMTTVNEPSILSLTNHCQQNWDGLIWLHLSSNAFSSCRKVEPRNIKVQHTHIHIHTLSAILQQTYIEVRNNTHKFYLNLQKKKIIFL